MEISFLDAMKLGVVRVQFADTTKNRLDLLFDLESQALPVPYYCAPLVFVSDAIKLLAVRRHNKPKTREKEKERERERKKDG